MGGSTSKESVKATIMNEINIKIKNETQNINKILNENMSETTSNVTATVAASIESSTGGSNVISGKNFVADGAGSVIDINQQISMQTIQKAAIQISSDVSSQTKLANEMSQNISNKVKSDNDLKNSLQSAAKLTSTKKDEGGIEKILDSAMNMINTFTKGITGQKISNEQETEIRNTINQDIQNITINENDIKDKVTTIINSNITSEMKNSCSSNITAQNIIEFDKMQATNGGKISIAQSSVVKALSDCVIKAANTAQITDEIIKVASTGTTTDTANTNKSEGSLGASATVENKEEHGAALTKLFSPGALLMPCIICCVIVIIIAAIAFFISQKKKDNTDSE